MAHFTSAMLFPPVQCDVLCLYVINSCDLSVLAMPLMGFPKKKYLDRGVGGWVELYPN